VERSVKEFNLDEFRLPKHIQQQAPKPPPGQGRTKRTVKFAKVPLWWAERAAKAGRNVNLMVCVDLVYRAWQAGGKPFIMPNRGGVRREAKTNALRALEKAGLIAVEWRDRKSPIVTLIIPIF
jgi:hypothetical protein